MRRNDSSDYATWGRKSARIASRYTCHTDLERLPVKKPRRLDQMLKASVEVLWIRYTEPPTLNSTNCPTA